MCAYGRLCILLSQASPCWWIPLPDVEIHKSFACSYVKRGCTAHAMREPGWTWSVLKAGVSPSLWNLRLTVVANDGFSELQQADGAWKYSSMSGSEKWMMNLLHMHRAQEKIHMRVVSVVSFSHQFVVFVFFSGSGGQLCNSNSLPMWLWGVPELILGTITYQVHPESCQRCYLFLMWIWVAESEEPLGNHRKIQTSPKHVVLCRKVIPKHFSVQGISELADDGSFIVMCVANYHVVDRACFSLNVSSSGRATKLGKIDCLAVMATEVRFDCSAVGNATDRCEVRNLFLARISLQNAS